MNPVFIVVMGAQKSLDEVEVPGGSGNREKGGNSFLTGIGNFGVTNQKGRLKRRNGRPHSRKI